MCVERNMLLGERLRVVREEDFGDDPAALGLPVETWLNDEGGVALPAAVLLEFIELTETSPIGC